MKLGKRQVGVYAEEHMEYLVRHIQDRLVHAHRTGEWWRLNL